MEFLKVTNLGAICNEPGGCKKGRKFDFEYFFREEPPGGARESDPAAGSSPDPSPGD